MHKIVTASRKQVRVRCGWATTAVAAALLMAGGHASSAPPTLSSEGPWAKGRLLVMANPGLPDLDLGKIVGVEGGKARRLTNGGLHLIELPGHVSERAVKARLAKHQHLKFVEYDMQVKGTSVANDPYFGSAWHLGRIAAPTAWDASLGAGITIAVLDTGVDSAHPDLASRMVPGWNFVDGNSNTSDVNGHGTGVAGAAAATTDNAMGVASVAGQARILPVRIADANAYAYWSDIAQGVTWAADKGARVINISYDQLPLSSAVISAANYARSKGALVVVAAGNRSQDENFAPTTSMIAVSATDASDLKTTWSSWGNYVALSAPGLNIWSTTRGGGYAQWWGTSVASPVAAGVVALMMSANPSLSNTTIESLLFKTADDLGAPGRDSSYGHGRVNATAAVAAARSAVVVAQDTTPPTIAITAPSVSSTVSGLANVGVSTTDSVGVAKVELRVNGVLVSTDTTTPFGFVWDTARVANGMSSLVARSCDASGNCADSPTVSVNVANATDLTPPTVAFKSPGNGSQVSGTVTVNTAAADNGGVNGLTMTLFINGVRVASSSGTGVLSHSWNTRKLRSGPYTLRVDARDAAGNSSSSSIGVTR